MWPPYRPWGWVAGAGRSGAEHAVWSIGSPSEVRQWQGAGILRTAVELTLLARNGSAALSVVKRRYSHDSDSAVIAH